MAQRITVLPGDVVAGPLSGSFDVAVLKSFIQVLSMEQARQAIKNVGGVVETNGAIYILGYILDNTRFTPAETAVMNLGFLNQFDEEQAYTEQEQQDWLIEAGFGDFTRVVLSNGHSIMTGRKQAQFRTPPGMRPLMERVLSRREILKA